jgi:TolA-binding protein
VRRGEAQVLHQQRQQQHGLKGRVVRLQWLLKARKDKGQAVKLQKRVLRQQQQEDGGARSWARQRDAALRQPASEHTATQPSSSSKAGRHRNGSGGSASRVIRPGWQVRGRAQWVDAALWPRQWQMATLPSQQHQSNGQ